MPSRHPIARSRSEAIALPRKTERSILREKSHDFPPIPDVVERFDAICSVACIWFSNRLGGYCFRRSKTVIERFFKQRDPAQVCMREKNISIRLKGLLPLLAPNETRSRRNHCVSP